MKKIFLLDDDKNFGSFVCFKNIWLWRYIISGVIIWLGIWNIYVVIYIYGRLKSIFSVLLYKYIKIYGILVL